MPLAAQAALWGGLSGLALVLGAAIGYFARLPQHAVASVMAFGTGVLISALTLELMESAVAGGGLPAAAAGFAFGVCIYSGANAVLALYGARHRKHSRRPPARARREVSAPAASAAIALGALLDGVPESAAIGVSLLDGKGVALVTVFAIFISNVPEGLSSAAGMRQAGKSAAAVFSLWTAIALASAGAAWFGYSVLGQLGPAYIAFAMATAAGAILVMIIQTMVPEAFEEMHGVTGPIAAFGFLLAFCASAAFG
ncbi:ZIP family zinc transporter [Parahaliea mediterranea]|uniref:ZIP family zinc transporter n=1 Tax=Parahaliea mediterranea TaxID=651086 RepID=A0A939IM07_9GAMM|nr:ZIP family zinc transporter [Parahaliea mediterranea]MBN7796517.1 ZIP family zinc transporter [Parahaliea mediterranea]